MMQRHQEIIENKPQTQVPQELAPKEKRLDSTEILDKINALTEETIMWSCANGREGSPCGCMENHNTPMGHPCPPGASPSNPIYFSNNPNHFACAPIRVRVKNGHIIGYVEG